jgi:hypothetical protein
MGKVKGSPKERVKKKAFSKKKETLSYRPVVHGKRW